MLLFYCVPHILTESSVMLCQVFALYFPSCIDRNLNIGWLFELLIKLLCHCVPQVLSKVPSLLEHLPSPFVNVKSLKLKVYLEFISSIKLNKVISFLLDSSTDADVAVEPLRYLFAPTPSFP